MGWVALDKSLVQYLKFIKGPYSEIEAMFVYTIDKNNGVDKSISWYATQWGWTRHRVRNFLKNIHAVEGHSQVSYVQTRQLTDRRSTANRHPVRFVDVGLRDEVDSKPTANRQVSEQPTSRKNLDNILDNNILVYTRGGGMGGEIKKPSKTKKKNKFTPPTLDEVIKYFLDNNFSAELAEHVFKYYDVADWQDSRGAKIKNWKQKMHGVWFKNENKIKPANKTNAANNWNYGKPLSLSEQNLLACKEAIARRKKRIKNESEKK